MNIDSQVAQSVAPEAHSLEHSGTFDHEILPFLEPLAAIHLTEKIG